MKHDEMVDYLKSLQRAYTWITVLTSEGPALECSVACAKGASELGWIAMDEWPVYRLSVPDNFDWQTILLKIKNGTLAEGDIKGSGLYTFCEARHGRIQDGETKMTPSWFCSFLSPLLRLNVNQSCKTLWTLVPMAESGEITYYTTEDSLERAFLDMYDFESWDGMSDDEVEYWYGKIKDNDGEGVFAYNLEE